MSTNSVTKLEILSTKPSLLCWKIAELSTARLLTHYSGRLGHVISLLARVAGCCSHILRFTHFLNCICVMCYAIKCINSCRPRLKDDSIVNANQKIYNDATYSGLPFFAIPWTNGQKMLKQSRNRMSLCFSLSEKNCLFQSFNKTVKHGQEFLLLFVAFQYKIRNPHLKFCMKRKADIKDAVYLILQIVHYVCSAHHIRVRSKICLSDHKKVRFRSMPKRFRTVTWSRGCRAEILELFIQIQIKVSTNILQN